MRVKNTLCMYRAGVFPLTDINKLFYLLKKFITNYVYLIYYIVYCIKIISKLLWFQSIT